MVNALELNVVNGKLEIRCWDCKSEIDHVLRFLKLNRMVCPYCGMEIDRGDLNEALKAGGPSLTVTESFSIPEGKVH